MLGDANVTQVKTAGAAVFQGASVTIGKASATTGTLVLHDSNSANTITLTVPDITAGSLTFTLPPTDGANTNLLQTDGNGVLTWRTAAQVMASLSGGAGASFSFNSQNLTSVGTIGCGSITTTGDYLLANGNYVGISANERLEFYTAGYAAFMGCNVGVGIATPTDVLHVYYADTTDEKGIKIESYAPSLKLIDKSADTHDYQILVNGSTLYLKHDSDNDGTFENTRLTIDESGRTIVSDHVTAATDQVVNVCYGTGNAPTANTTTIGSIFVKYVA
jgi:hypothetical protein